MSERYEYSIENFMDCLRTGYVDSSFDSDARYTPRFVTNNSASNTSLLAVLGMLTFFQPKASYAANPSDLLY